MKTKGLNLLKPVMSNSQMEKNDFLRRRSDADFHKLRVDCTNDAQMIAAELRPAKISIDRTVFGKDKIILKTVKKRITDLREEFTNLIVNAKHPRMNVVFIPMK